MRLYEVTTDCLVDNCLVRWYVKARDERTAWAIGYNMALKSNIADSGCVDVKRCTEYKKGVKIYG